MSHSVVRPLKHDALRLTRWAILILPLFFCGCFEAQSAKPSATGKLTGISSMTRFFASGFEEPSAKPSEAETGPAAFTYYSPGITAAPELAADLSENAIAAPSYMGAGKEGNPFAPQSGYSSGVSAGRARLDQAANFRNSVSLVFNTPFNLIFSKVFKQTKSEETALSASKDELPNPFTEVIQKQQSSDSDESSSAKTTAADNKTDSSDQAKTEDTNAKDSSKSVSNNSAATTGSTGVSAGSFLIVGDFDGSGSLKAVTAQRSSDTRFVSADGVRDFNLYINDDAVARRRSFYVDDINMDGNPDILVTGLAWLFGGVYLGDGAGGYRLADKFVTGYEPTIVSAGPMVNGMREIVAVSSRTGQLRSFLYADRYWYRQEGKLDFAPNYLLHLVSSDTSLDYVLAAQTGGTEQILGWAGDGSINPVGVNLGADAAVLGRDCGSYTLQGYRVGDYASIVLTSQGVSFNVANMRLTPRTFLVIGDLKRKGTLDVAVAGLEAFTPAQ